MKTLDFLKDMRRDCPEEWKALDEAIEELETIANASCKNCLYNSFCGIYSYLKRVQNEDKEVDAFRCNQYKKGL